jgi:hypothetical protein
MKKLNITKELKILGILVVICITAIFVFASTTTFTKTGNSYYGHQAAENKLVVTITPTAADPNSATSTAVSTDPVFGILQRITLGKTGTDTAFTVTVKDENLITVFTKTDCNSALLPLSYALISADTAGNKYCGVPVAGLLTVATAAVDPNNLTSITVTLYYEDYRYAGN